MVFEQSVNRGFCVVLPRLRGRKLGAGAQCGQSGKQEAEGLGWVGGSISEPHGAALLSWLVLRLWLGRTGGWKSLPLSKCVPPPTMRAAALSHLLPVAGCIYWGPVVIWWADDSVKLRSLSAAGSASAAGAVRPVAAPARIRAQLLPTLPSPKNAATPTPVTAQGLA